MKKQQLLDEISEGLSALSYNHFQKLWNSIFSEERISSEDEDQKEDLSELLMEEIEYFEKEKIVKIYNFISSKM